MNITMWIKIFAACLFIIIFNSCGNDENDGNDYNIPMDTSIENRKFTGIPSIAITPNGTIWAVWYSGLNPAEDYTSFVVLSVSNDDGQSWEEVMIIDPDGFGSRRAFDPQIWLAPDNSLWLFWTETIEFDIANGNLYAKKTYDIDNKHPQWSEVIKIANGLMVNKPLVHSDGSWLLPISTWFTDFSAKVFITTNNGKTWGYQGASNIPSNDRLYDEHSIIEKKDKTLWMLARTKYGIGESFSYDKGRTWTDMRPSTINHISARFHIRRLSSGNLLLIKHGRINEITPSRSNLTAFISEDEGRSWSKGLLIEENSVVSYPDGQQIENGHIYIIYDFNRTVDQLVIMTNFSENDIINQVDIKDRKKIISKSVH